MIRFIIIAITAFLTTGCVGDYLVELEQDAKRNAYEKRVASLDMTTSIKYDLVVKYTLEACKWIEQKGTNCDNLEIFIVTGFEKESRIGEAYTIGDHAYVAYKASYLEKATNEQIRALAYHEVIHVAIERLDLCVGMYGHSIGRDPHNFEWQTMMVEAGFDAGHGHSNFNYYQRRQ